jgi:hypothetical protein
MCVFYICRLENLSYNIYPLVVIMLQKNTRNTFSNTASHMELEKISYNFFYSVIKL